MKHVSRRVRRIKLFHPVVVLGTAVLAALAAAAIVTIVLEGELEWFLLYYSVPIGVPFVAFLFDRAERRATLTRGQWLIDVPLVGLALTRAVVPVPLISGHALFLAYALLTTRSRVARWTAAAVLLQVAYVKIVLWHDPTLFGGALLGAAAAWAFGRLASVFDPPASGGVVGSRPGIDEKA